jgi:hypothetical protein
MKAVRGGGIGFFTADRPVPLSSPGKTVLKITLDNPRRTAYTLEFLGGDAELFVVPGECYFDGPSVIYVTLKYPEGSVTKGVLDITLRLKPKEPGYVRPENITLPLECAVRQVPFSYAGMYASPNTLKKMILCFDADIEGFSTDNITFAENAATPIPVPGPLKPVAPGVYEFEAAGITGKPPKVEVNPPDGYAVIPQSLAVTVGGDEPVRFLGAAPDNDVSVMTAGLYLYFDKDIDGLGEDDITIDGPATVVPETLRNDFGMAGIYHAALNVTGIGTITVKVNKSGCRIDPESKTVQVKTGEPAAGAADMPSIRKKFGVPATATGTAGVTVAFSALHEFIQAGGLASQPNIIKLGDYINLDGELTVAAYSGGGGVAFTAANTALNPSQPPFTGYEGSTLRLIVVGINSFNGKNGNNTPHVVFHFQNIPVSRRLNPTRDNTGGYALSEMRKYLAPVEGNDASGNFLKGLIAAGVPEGVLWGPERALANGTNGTGNTLVSDKLWLPTEWEMFGFGGSSANGESSGNQAWLAYYTKNEHRVKYNSTGGAINYWMSSPSGKFDSGIWYISASGGLPSSSNYPTDGMGVAPAFCVW